MVHILSLPPEILHEIFSWLGLDDLGIVPRTCHQFNDIVRKNQRLFRSVYLNHLDAPRNRKLDWIREVQDAVKLQTICTLSSSESVVHPPPREQFDFVVNTVTRLLTNASPLAGTKPREGTPTHMASRNVTLLSSLFQDIACQDAYLCRSPLFLGTAEAPPRDVFSSDDPVAEQSARLHSLYGQPLVQGRNPGSRQRPVCQPYHYACSKVYNLQEYTQGTFWGPFKRDGSGDVDWQKVEAIMVVLAENMSSEDSGLRVITDAPPFSGSYAHSYTTPNPVGELPPPDDADFYGINGTWMRVVSFMNWEDLQTFNFPEVPETLGRLQALTQFQATRHVMMNLKVTRVADACENEAWERPVVHFSGTAQTLYDGMGPDNYSEVRGTCSRTREGEVRWTLFSIFDHEVRWRSEGVQLGGVRSARGVVGNWFEVDYARDGPVGPNAFWKISDLDINKLSPEEMFFKNTTWPFGYFLVEMEDMEAREEEHELPFGWELVQDLVEDLFQPGQAQSQA